MIQTELAETTLSEEENYAWVKCKRDPSYFVRTYCHIFNANEATWLLFDLWPAQADALRLMQQARLALVLKARQLGLTWLALSYALWQMIFFPAATILLFSQRDEEAIDMLARLKGMLARLPAFLQSTTVADNKHELVLRNGSSARSFPTTAGRSYTGSLVIVDEADFIPDLDLLLTAVKPTIDGGGQMFLVSTADKSQPESAFKRLYRSSKMGESASSSDFQPSGAENRGTGWQSLFLPWWSRPGRTDSWYAALRAEILARTTALDDLFQEYPASEPEALAPRSLDKRISPLWLTATFAERPPLPLPRDAPALAGLEIFHPPARYGGNPYAYVLGADPAEGNPTSDDSAITVLDVRTGCEQAALAQKLEPATFGAAIIALSRYYFNAPVLVERNNHGHAVIQWLQEHGEGIRLLKGHDDKVGWMSSKLSKSMLYDECADHFRQNASLDAPEFRQFVLHCFATYTQLSSIEGATLRAPKEQHDDRAIAYALAVMGRIQASSTRVLMRQVRVMGRGGQPMIRSRRSAPPQRRRRAPRHAKRQ